MRKRTQCLCSTWRGQSFQICLQRISVAFGQGGVPLSEYITEFVGRRPKSIGGIMKSGIEVKWHCLQ